MRTQNAERVMRLSSRSLTAAASSALCPELSRGELTEEGARQDAESDRWDADDCRLVRMLVLDQCGSSSSATHTVVITATRRVYRCTQIAEATGSTPLDYGRPKEV